jgi:chorismate mutase / prephenate dehydratase
VKKMPISVSRRKIDALDANILELLSVRARLAQGIGRSKTERGEEFYSPHREKEVLGRIVSGNPGPLRGEEVENIFREILHSCRSLQARLKVAYFGPEASFTHQAALKNFGKYTDYIPAKAISDVFQEVEQGRADYGVVPIENSTEGAINYTLDMFLESDIKICAEMNMRIHECLLSRSKNAGAVRKIYSFPPALAQCRNWLETNMPGVAIADAASTAEAAKTAGKDRSSAAIASKLAGELYGLSVIAENIEDVKENYTRFLVIGHKCAEKSRCDKTSVMFSVKDRIGALHDMLVPFRKFNINLTKIESRPTKKKLWEYMFFVDFSGHINDKRVRKALALLEKQCVFLKVLGSYPQAE